MATLTRTDVTNWTTRYDKTGAPFLIAAYEPGFRDALQSFYEEFEPKRAAQGLPPADPGRIRGWLDSILNRGVHLVACRDGELIGHGFVMPTPREGVGEYAVFLREDLRGRGVGTELNRAVVEAARSSGYRGLWLTVEPRNRSAIRSYEKAGFHFIPASLLTVEAEMELQFPNPP